MGELRGEDMKKYITVAILAVVATTGLASTAARADDHMERAVKHQFRADRQDMKSQRDAMVGDEYGAMKHAVRANREEHRSVRNEGKLLRDGY
jgi:hypothetical protein